MAADEKTPKGKPEDGNAALADALLAAIGKMQPAQAGLSADQLQTILDSNAKSTRKALRPENERHPDVSAFNPAGERDHPRPKLARKTFMAGQLLHEDELTVTEIELFNQFTHSTEARNGAWTADLRRTGKMGEEQLHVSVPCGTVDDRMDLPNGITTMLRELLGGAKAVDPESLAQRVAELEAQLASK